jgi:hypothetical protein
MEVEATLPWHRAISPSTLVAGACPWELIVVRLPSDLDGPCVPDGRMLRSRPTGRIKRCDVVTSLLWRAVEAAESRSAGDLPAAVHGAIPGAVLASLLPESQRQG